MKEIKTVFPFFDNDLISDIEHHAVIHQYKTGDVLMRTGQYIKNTILVIKGKIKIYREDENGGEFFMYYLQPGQACAISMLCAAKAEKSQIMAKVVEDAEVIMVPLHLMDNWMKQYKSWYEFVIDTYRSRFEEVLQVLDSIAFNAMDERLEFYLKRQQQATNSTEIKLSHQEIATDLNTSREVISRLLKKMEQLNKVKLYRNYITLL
jgi:CRP/FNR family transcriptional regulator